MRKAVRVVVDERQEFDFDLEGAKPMTHETAREWLDQQFIALGCEPLRASGKVLLADKVLVVARAAGPKLLAEAAWGEAFASAASAALAKVRVTVDLGAMTITY